MPSVNAGKNPVTHLPISPGTGTVTIPVVAGSTAPRTLAQTTSGPRTLTIGGVNVNVDVTRDGPINIVDRINQANIPGSAGATVVASLDRYGQLNINGVSSVSGDALLLQHLGFN